MVDVEQLRLKKCRKYAIMYIMVYKPCDYHAGIVPKKCERKFQIIFAVCVSCHETVIDVKAYCINRINVVFFASTILFLY